MRFIQTAIARALFLTAGCAGCVLLSALPAQSATTDTNPPAILRAAGADNFTTVLITFSEPVAPGTIVASNFTVSGGIAVISASLRDPSTALLVTSRQSPGTLYTVTVRNIRDLADPPNLITPNPSTVSFTAFILQRGFVQHKLWQPINPPTIPGLVSDPRFPGNPTLTSYEPAFEYPPNGQGEGGTNYGNQLSAFLIPPLTGDYVFYCNGDDAVEVYLSASTNAAEKTLICRDQQGTNPRQWVSAARPGAPDAPENRSNPIPLQAGKLYYLELLHAESSGGDNAGLAWQIPGARPPANGSAPIPGNYLAVYLDAGNASVTITQQPQDVVIIEGTSASFTVGAQGSGTLSYQWQKAPPGGVFADILVGATGRAYTTPTLFAADDGSRYRVVVSVPGATTVSAEATVTVEKDITGPLLLSARRSFSNSTKVLVTFSEPVAAASAGAATNYQVDHAISVTAARVTPANSNVVELTTSAIPAGTTNILTVNNVEDLFGNRIATNSQVLIEFAKGLLMVVGNTPLLSDGDTVISNRLADRGFEVEILPGVNSTTSNAAGKDLILVSSTVNETDIGDKFQRAAAPVLLWEETLQDDFRMTGDFAGIEFDRTPNQTAVEITDPDHPMAAGFIAGPVPVVTTPQSFGWGQPPPTAQRVAQVPGEPGMVVIYGYEKGALMVNGFTAPARRVMFFPSEDAPAAFTVNGLTLFDAAVDWALNITTNTPGQTGLRFASITAETNNVLSLTWTGGDGPYLLQSKPGLSASNWLNLVTTSNETARVPIISAAGFYRLVDRATNPVILLTAVLSGTNERPAVVSTATGIGAFSLSGTQLTYQVSYAGLRGNASAAHIHGFTNTTGSAGIIIPFPNPTGSNGFFSGSVNVTDQQRAGLLAGLTYVNIHSSVAASGEIRGQIAPAQFQARLSGANERPNPVATSGTGSAKLSLVGNELSYDIVYSGLSSPANAAHIHGPAGTNEFAAVLVGLGTPSGLAGNLSGRLTLTQDQLNHLLNGQTYVNIHTVNNGGGEIRGQVVP